MRSVHCEFCVLRVPRFVTSSYNLLTFSTARSAFGSKIGAVGAAHVYTRRKINCLRGQRGTHSVSARPRCTIARHGPHHDHQAPRRQRAPYGSKTTPHFHDGSAERAGGKGRRCGRPGTHITIQNYIIFCDFSQKKNEISDDFIRRHHTHASCTHPARSAFHSTGLPRFPYVSIC